MKYKILVVDDEPDVQELVAFNLKSSGYDVLVASDGNEALKKAQEQLPHLIVLDIMLPEIDGTEVCKLLRRNPETSTVPIIMLTAKAAEIDRIIGLEIGADDYMTKPFSPRELVLRIKKLLQRTQAPEPDKDLLKIGCLEIDIPRHVVTVENQPVDLTATEFNLLSVLMHRKGRVQTRDRLLQDVWGYERSVDTRTVDTHMRRLREKLGAASVYLETVRNVGYRFVD
jgi:two-component system phosphate regulon response regulator PhoB